MTILALEFSSDTRSVALLRDGAMFEAVETVGRSTAAFRMIETVLAQAKTEREQVDVIAVGLGPGSYTGIRAAIAIAEGWTLARPVWLVGISSALAIAVQAQAEKNFGQVDVIIDAQRGEVYRAGYEISDTSLTEIEPLKIDSPGQALAGRCAVGPQVTKWYSSGKVVVPKASTIATLAGKIGAGADAKLEPIYLRETTFVKAPPPRFIA